MRFFAILTLLLAMACPAAAQTRSWDEVTLVFATQEEGAALLSTPDAYTERTTAYDRSGLLKTDQPVSQEEFLAFLGKQARGWNEGEVALIRAAFKAIGKSLTDLQLPLPATLTMIKTTGEDADNAAYTRGGAIVLPPKMMQSTAVEREYLMAHELFHVISRQNPALREALYAAIGFVKGSDAIMPEEYTERLITNPDAPRNDHFIRVTLSDDPVCAIPVLFSGGAEYNRSENGGLLGSAIFMFVVTDERTPPGDTTPGTYRFAPAETMKGFYEQIGRNTDYILHPEEILADNFAFLVTAKKDLKSPEIPEKMRKIFTRFAKDGGASAPVADTDPAAKCR